MTWLELKLFYKVLSLLLRKQSQLVDIMSVTQILHLKSILLQFERLQKLVDGYFRHILSLVVH